MADGASVLKAYFTARKRLSANLRSLEKRAYFVRSKDGTFVSPKTLLPDIPKNVLKYRKKLKAGKELTKRQIEEIKASTRRLETINKQRYEKTVGAGGVTARRQRQIEREQATFKASVTKARKYREKEARESQRIREEIEEQIREKEATEEQREYEDEMYEDEGEEDYSNIDDWIGDYINEYEQMKQQKIESEDTSYIEQETLRAEADDLAREAETIVYNFLEQCEPWLDSLIETGQNYGWNIDNMRNLVSILKRIKADIDEGKINNDVDDLTDLLTRLNNQSELIQNTIDLIKTSSEGQKDAELNIVYLSEIFLNRALTMLESSQLNDSLERMWGYTA